MNVQPFNATATGVQVTATAAASIAVAIPGVGNTLRVVNESSNPVYLAFGASSVLASLPGANAATNCNVVLGLADVTFSRNPFTEQFFSMICKAAQTAVVDVYTAEGL